MYHEDVLGAVLGGTENQFRSRYLRLDYYKNVHFSQHKCYYFELLLTHAFVEYMLKLDFACCSPILYCKLRLRLWL